MDVCVQMGGKRRTRNVRGTGEEGARRSGAKDLEWQERTAVPIGALLPLIQPHAEHTAAHCRKPLYYTCPSALLQFAILARLPPPCMHRQLRVLVPVRVDVIIQ